MNKKGFLLFEVMVSIVLVSAGIIFIARSYSSSKDSIQKSGELIKIALYMENKMWEFEDAGEIGESRTGGNFEDDKRYCWVMTAEPEDSGLNLVRLGVFKKDAPGRAEYFISTYLKNKKE